MATQTLAVKYRPSTWEEVIEQGSTVTILKQQLERNEVKNAYLFCGPAGCGKTTCARIFATDINGGQGNPIELDAASNNSVDDVREIIQQAKTKSLDSEYKIFILDECHALSNSAWQAMLKLIEEPPAKSIFIFCTTDPQKIPKTILSRVQRYDFHRISQQGIVKRLNAILNNEMENMPKLVIRIDALEYIAKIADGGMRDAITLMDKCLAYSDELTIETVAEVCGAVKYDALIRLTDSILNRDAKEVISQIEMMYADGKDLKLFVKDYMLFLLDVQKYFLGPLWRYMTIPKIDSYERWFKSLTDSDASVLRELLSTAVNLDADIKYSATPKYDIEAVLLGCV